MSQNKVCSEKLVDTLKQGKPILLDGGLATELEAQGHNIKTDLWSAGLLQTSPDAIVAAHRSYLDAGAQCLISASYQASRHGFMSLGLSSAAADQLIIDSVTLARQARDDFLQHSPVASRSILIAASVGPFGATLHDGSEYTGNYPISADALRDFHATRLQLLDHANADLLACETIPSFTEAKVLCELLEEVSSPAWVSFSCRDALHISDGTPIKKVAKLFRNHPRVFAVGINCTPPQFVTSLIRQIKQAAPGKAIVAYPNSGEIYADSSQTWFGTVTPIECAKAARQWLDTGAQLIGGCCRMGPAHIAAMAKILNSTGAA